MKPKIPSTDDKKHLESDNPNPKIVESNTFLNPENVADVTSYEAKASREMPVNELWNKIGFHTGYSGAG